MRKFTTVQKVTIGFAVLTLILVAAVAITLWQVDRTQVITNKLVNLSAPMSDTSLRVINGINTAGVQQRGYMLLGDEQFKAGRAAAFTDWVDPSFKKLQALVQLSGNATQIEQVKTVESRLTQLKLSQAAIEAIARTDSNFPAQVLLEIEVGPRVDSMILNITAMMDDEIESEASSESRQLLYELGNLRSVTGRFLATLRQYLASGDAEDEQQVQQLWRELERLQVAISAKNEELSVTQSEHWKYFTSNRMELVPLLSEATKTRQSDKWNVALAMLRDETDPLTASIRETLEQFIADLEPENLGNREALVDQTAFLKRMQWILLAIGIILSELLAVTTIRSIRKALADLTASTEEVRTASTEIATGSQQQVAALNQTAASLNQITAAAEQFKATMQEFSDRARAVQDAAKETAKQSSEGRALAQESGTRIEQVRVNSVAAGESVLKLAEQMQRIGEITATVNEIAEQTKLLALNASIEAARAGDEGRGFAVVATQVRELANQSKDAAGRIESLIANTHKSMQDVVAKIENGNRLSEESTNSVRQMTQNFDEIALAIDQTTGAMAQINTGARQQEQGIAQLVTSITQIDSASKESLASAEQTQRAILSIDAEIKRLNNTMAEF